MNIRSVRWDLTQRCTQNCMHCYAAAYRFGLSQEINTYQADVLADRLINAGVNEFSITGGDIMLSPNLDRLLMHLRGAGCWVELVSNMINITPELADCFCDLSSYPDRICCAVNGPSPEGHESLYGNGSYIGVGNMVNLMRRIRKAGLPTEFTANIMVMKLTRSWFSQTVSWCHSVGFDHIYMSKVVPVGNAVPNWDSLVLSPEETLALAEEVIATDVPTKKLHFAFLTPLGIDLVNKKHGTDIEKQFSGCAYGYELYLDNTGRLYPCQCISEIERSGGTYPITFSGNNLLDMNFESIYDSPGFAIEQEKVNQGLYLNYEPCNRCKYVRSFCMPCHRYYLRGESKPFPLCSYIANKNPILLSA